MLKHLPNALTLLRLILAIPLGMAILDEAFHLALGIGLVAGLSDALDGFFARRLNALSRFGAIIDPVADKLIITACFLCFALVGLVPWYLACIVIGRDLIIVTGAACYSLLYVPFEFAATNLSKANMFFQICFCLLVLLHQVVPGIPGTALIAGTVLVVIFAVASGADYVITWTIKALNAHKKNS